MSSAVRVRFAPSPTGFMHLGNVRAALLNFLFARHFKGAFIVRIEDTDAARNLDVAAQKIFDDLAWLGLSYNEGPGVGGQYGPYKQSERAELYQKYLNELIQNQKVYRCFCTPEELERKRERQVALKKPPRYDRTCLHLSEEKIKGKLAFGIPFIWRFALNVEQLISIKDLAKGNIDFEMHNFADFPLTRADGSFTFIFANFIDDWLMEITHVVRGEDHLSNTALQAALYDAFAVKLPIFWHLPMICNGEGKKLSKRDFGFSLDDLIQNGFMAEAVVNYLSKLGSSSNEEVQSIDEIIASYNFENIHSSAAVRYDIEKLTWFNHQWIQKVSKDRLYRACKPLLEKVFTEEAVVAMSDLDQKILLVRSEMKRLTDVIELLSCCFIEPNFEKKVLQEIASEEQLSLVLGIISESKDLLNMPDLFLEKMQHATKVHKGIAPLLWKSLRYALTGSLSGMSFKECALLLSHAQLVSRIALLCSMIK